MLFRKNLRLKRLLYISELRKLSEKIDSTEKSSRTKSKQHPSASLSTSKPKPSSKPQHRGQLCSLTNHTTDNCYKILFCMICMQEDHRTSDHKSHLASLNAHMHYKTQNHPYPSPSKQRSKAKPFLPCPYHGFNVHLPDDCMMSPCCNICGDPSHDDSGHDKVTHARRGNTPQSAQSSSTSKCKNCGSSVHSTSDHYLLSKFKKTMKAKPTRKWVNKKN